MSQGVAKATAKYSLWHVCSASSTRGVIKDSQFREQTQPPLPYFNGEALMVNQGDRNQRKKVKELCSESLEIGGVKRISSTRLNGLGQNWDRRREALLHAEPLGTCVSESTEVRRIDVKGFW